MRGPDLRPIGETPIVLIGERVVPRDRPSMKQHPRMGAKYGDCEDRPVAA